MLFGEPLFMLLPSAGGISLGAGALVAAAALAGMLPWRGGAGQHAHAGPGTLTVWQLCPSDGSTPQRRDEDRMPYPGMGTPEPVSEKIGWTETGDSEPFWPQPVWPEDIAQTPRVLEPGALWDEPMLRGECVEQGYLGRHRLVSPFEKFRTDLVFSQ
ncbi:hypothetical protein [Haloactinomyces albus]|uniref:Uncharacterized protein n=1 Tax=Haloactinomyces albus TaxID=1352928 RepID=A0AAE3ZDW4_9ACTN|nr:hypothetical protein [Haloactinomyces albus]MDR7301868.1 hypothetical protein [Haloactinomyces albus]